MLEKGDQSFGGRTKHVSNLIGSQTIKKKKGVGKHHARVGSRSSLLDLQPRELQKLGVEGGGNENGTGGYLSVLEDSCNLVN